MKRARQINFYIQIKKSKYKFHLATPKNNYKHMKRARQINFDTQGNVYCEFHVTNKKQL